MSRKLWINIHLYLAAFFAPMLLLVAVSGGLYLIGVKGNVEQQAIALPASAQLDPSSKELKQQVDQLLSSAGIEHSFEYVKVKGNTLYTRPTSRVHYQFNLKDTGITATRNVPNLQSRMIELHKGHGPTLFKTLQKALAVGLLIIVLSGLWLGLTSAGLRLTTSLVAGLGLLVFILAAAVL
jgi:hypothetical protein